MKKVVSIILSGFIFACFVSCSKNLTYNEILAKAESQLNNNDFSGAQKTYNLALEENALDSAVYEGLAKAEHGLGEYEKAIEYWLLAIEMNPGSKLLYFNLSDSYRAAGNTEKATAELLKAVDVFPGGYTDLF